MQLRDEPLLLLRVVDLEVEPLVELLGGPEHLGEEEVEERPQLVQAGGWLIVALGGRGEGDVSAAFPPPSLSCPNATH